MNRRGLSADRWRSWHPRRRGGKYWIERLKEEDLVTYWNFLHNTRSKHGRRERPAKQDQRFRNRILRRYVNPYCDAELEKVRNEMQALSARIRRP